MHETRQAARLGWTLYWLNIVAAGLVVGFGIASVWLFEGLWPKILSAVGSVILATVFHTVGRFCRQLATDDRSAADRNRRSICLSSLLAASYWRRVRE